MIENVYLEHKQNIIRINCSSNHRNDVFNAISSILHLSSDQFYLTQNGKLINNDSINGNNNDIYVHLKLIGGKGGFGSMLRAIGAQIEKTTNREACRDLSGRRLRDINEEKRLKAWLEKQNDEDNDEAAKIARKIEKLRQQPKHEFKDDEYFNARSHLAEDVSDALEEGLKNVNNATATTSSSSNGNDSNNSDEACGSGIKRKNANANGKGKGKKKLKGAQWLDEGLSSSDESSDESNDDCDNATATPLKHSSTELVKN